MYVPLENVHIFYIPVYTPENTLGFGQLNLLDHAGSVISIEPVGQFSQLAISVFSNTWWFWF